MMYYNLITLLWLLLPLYNAYLFPSSFTSLAFSSSRRSATLSENQQQMMMMMHKQQQQQQQVGRRQTRQSLSLSETANSLEEEEEEEEEVDNHDEPKIARANYEDMRTYAFLLSNVTDCMDSAPEQALSLLSKNLGWLFSHDVPKLTEMLLTEAPELRQDSGMMRGYMFIMDFLELVSKRSQQLVSNNQKLMRSLLEATKISERHLDQFIADNVDQLTSSEFMVYLDSEIENQPIHSHLEHMLVTVKLRLLDEKGKTMGVDVMMLPKLAAEEDPAELRRKTIAHISPYDNDGKALFLQTLRIMMKEMKARYAHVDPLLLLNLQEVEKIVEGELKMSRSPIPDEETD